MNERTPEAPAADRGAETNLPGDLVYQGAWRRFVAALIDNLTWLIALSWYFGQLGAELYRADEVAGAVYFLAFFSAWFNYFTFCEWRWGQTIGKNAMGMRVISLDRTRPSFGQASLRNLLRLVDFFGIGWVMIATDRRSQRLGDKVARTVVVGKSRRGAKHYGAATTAPVPPTPAARTTAPAPAPQTAAAAPAAVPATSAPDPPGGIPTPGRLPRIDWDLSATIRGLVGGLLIGGIFAPLLVVPFDPSLESEAATLVAQGLFGTTLAVFAVGVAARWRFGSVREGLSRLGLRRVGWSGIGIGLLTLLVYYAAAILFAALVVQPDQEDIAGELGVRDPNLLVAISAVLLIALVAPLSEELFFRGMVFAGLRTRLSLWPAALISGIVFGLPHVLTGPLASIQLAALGVALSWLYERTGSLWPCILIHVINNSLALAVTA